MAGVIAHAEGGPRRRRKIGVIVAVSALAHLAILSLVGFSAPQMIFKVTPPEPAINVWLTPDITPAAHKPKPQPAVAARTSPQPAPAVRPARPTAAQTPVQAPAPPVRAPGAPASTATSPGAPAGRSSAPAAAEGGGSAEEALRTSVGCDFDKTVHLTPAERDKCNQSFGAMARRTPPFSGIDPLKRGRFDEQAAADERRRAARTGPMAQPVEDCGGGMGCLPESAVGHWKIPSPNN